MTLNITKAKHIMLSLLGIIALLGGGWFLLFSLTSYEVTQAQLEEIYKHTPPTEIHWQQTPLDEYNVAFTFNSFDGSKVIGRIRYPLPLSEITKPIPILIGVHAMGRSQIRWFQDSYKERPTFESVDKITDQAIKHGYAVIAIDNRNHGKRKDLNYSIIDIMKDLHYWGKREPYETMIINSVRDHRVLLDWIVKQPQFDANHIDVSGYSMGAQISLLLAGLDERITDVAAIVPPYLDNKTAKVAPINILSRLEDKKVWLLTADNDEYASQKQNKALFEAIPSDIKRHFSFDSGHLLPSHYVDKLTAWF